MWERWLRIVGALLALALCFAAGVVVGGIGGNLQAYHLRYLEERDAFAPVLAGDPAFAGVVIQELSCGGIWLAGEVPTASDLDRLRSHAVRALGESRAEVAMLNVGVRR